MVCWETDEKTDDLQAYQIMTINVETCPMHPHVFKSKNGVSKKPKSIVVEDYVVLASLMRNSRISWKNARRKVDIPIPAAMPCKPPICQSSKRTCCTVGKHKTKYACIGDSDKSLRIRLQGVPHRYQSRSHFAAKGMNSLSHHNMERKFIPMPQTNRMQRQHRKKCEELQRIPARQLTKVNNKRDDRRS